MKNAHPLTVAVLVTGALTAVRSATGLIRIGLGALGIQFGGLLPLVAGFVPHVAALALVLAAFRVAYQTNLGGFRDLVVQVAHAVGLAVRALTQLFTEGGFSGAVRDELHELAQKKGVLSISDAVLVHQAITHFGVAAKKEAVNVQE